MQYKTMFINMTKSKSSYLKLTSPLWGIIYSYLFLLEYFETQKVKFGCTFNVHDAFLLWELCF